MKFTTQVRMKMAKDCVLVQPCNLTDLQLFGKIIEKQKEVLICEVSTPIKAKSYDQVKTVWKLVELIFISQEGRKPTEEERRALYEDLLEEYAMKRPSNINPNKLVPIHVSKTDTKACAYFIQGLMFHLASYCDLNVQDSTQVKQLLAEWQEWYGSIDASEIENVSMAEYHEMHPYSEASGLGGDLHLHHIVPKGASEKLRDVTANWVILTVAEHSFLHNYGEKKFIERFPHLRNKFARANALKR